HSNADADFDADAVCLGSATPFTNTSTVASGSINQRTWRFGNPQLGTSSSNNPNFTFPSADTFDVRLIVRTNNNCRDTIEKPVLIYASPQASWGVSPNDTVCIGTSLTFDGMGTPNMGTIVSYAWDFDNGENSSQEDTSITFATAGTYTVTLTVENSVGCPDD